MSLLTKKYTPYIVERITGTQGNKSYATIASGYYIGFIQPISGNERFDKQKSGEDSTHRLYTPVGAALQEGDKITDKNGQIYIVVFSEQADGISAMSHHKEILLRVFE